MIELRHDSLNFLAFYFSLNLESLAKGEKDLAIIKGVNQGADAFFLISVMTISKVEN